MQLYKNSFIAFQPFLYSIEIDLTNKPDIKCWKTIIAAGCVDSAKEHPLSKLDEGCGRKMIEATKELLVALVKSRKCGLNHVRVDYVASEGRDMDVEVWLVGCFNVSFNACIKAALKEPNQNENELVVEGKEILGTESSPKNLNRNHKKYRTNLMFKTVISSMTV